MEIKKEKGLEALRNLTQDQRNDPKALLEINKKYGLGYAYIIEFCSNRLAKVIHAYETYLEPAVKDFSFGLEIIANKDSELKNNPSNTIVPSAVLNSYFDLKPKDSIQLVNEIDKANKKNAEEFGKKFANALNGLGGFLLNNEEQTIEDFNESCNSKQTQNDEKKVASALQDIADKRDRDIQEITTNGKQDDIWKE